MDTKVMELAGQAEIVKNAVADKAVAVIEQYRKGKYPGREVSIILAELFEAVNDTVERRLADAALKANASMRKRTANARPHAEAVADSVRVDVRQGGAT